MEDEEEGELVYRSPSPGRAEYWKDKLGNYHRLNGPAIVFANGDTSWFKHGVPHRDDGPAREWFTRGIEAWYKDGQKYEPSAHELMLWKMKQKKKA